MSEARPATFDELLGWLERRTNYERQSAPPPGGFRLERMEALLELLGRPERACPAVHVAGTKGKGTTCAALASLLDACGLRVGLYTSPHLVSLRERIRLGAAPAPDALWLDAARRVLPAAGELGDSGDPPTFFEVTTALAFEVYRAAGADLVVLETGLGGRVDATNVVRPVAVAITRIARDHVAVLGADTAAIAREKAGVIKAGVPVVAAPVDPAAIEVVRARAGELGAPLELLGRELEREVLSAAPLRARLTTPRGSREVATPLVGAALADDLLLAVAGAEHALAALGRGGLGDAAVARGLGRLRWRGRFDRVQPPGGPLVVVDAAHDEASARALVAAWDAAFPGVRPVLLLGVSADKDLPAIAGALGPAVREAFCCRAGSPRAAAPERLVELLVAAGAPAEAVEEGPAVAFARAAARADELGVPLLATGSIFLAGDVLALLGQDVARAWEER